MSGCSGLASLAFLGLADCDVGALSVAVVPSRALRFRATSLGCTTAVLWISISTLRTSRLSGSCVLSLAYRLHLAPSATTSPGCMVRAVLWSLSMDGCRCGWRTVSAKCGLTRFSTGFASGRAVVGNGHVSNVLIAHASLSCSHAAWICDCHVEFSVCSTYVIDKNLIAHASPSCSHAGLWACSVKNA